MRILAVEDDSALTSLDWTIIMVFIFALFGGTYLASLVKSRLKNISDTLNEVADGDSSARIFVSPKEDDIDRLSHQINDALDKLESLMSRYSSSKFWHSALIAETYEAVCSEKQQTLNTRLDNHEQLIIQGDKRLLTQMLVNLLENSILSVYHFIVLFIL